MRYKNDWPVAQQKWTNWWNHQQDQVLLQTFSPGDPPPTVYPNCWGFHIHKDNPAKYLEEFEIWCEGMAFHDVAYPNLWVNLGPGSIAAYLHGFCEFNHESSTAWFEKHLSWEDIEKIKQNTGNQSLLNKHLQDNEWWQYTLLALQMLAKAGKDKYFIGGADIGGNLDILASLRGSQTLLMDVLEDPQRVVEAVEWIDKIWVEVYDRMAEIITSQQEGTSFWMGLWSPKRWYPLQCDFSYMISPRMFEKFVAPSLIQATEFLDHSIYHLDGIGELPHIDILLDMPHLDGIQWVPGTGNPQCEDPRWLPLYEKILAKDKLLVLQCFDRPWEALEILKKIPKTGVLISAWFSTCDEARRYQDAVWAV